MEQLPKSLEECTATDFNAIEECIPYDDIRLWLTQKIKEIDEYSGEMGDLVGSDLTIISKNKAKEILRK